jgi:hypothetical protein
MTLIMKNAKRLKIYIITLSSWGIFIPLILCLIDKYVIKFSIGSFVYIHYFSSYLVYPFLGVLILNNLLKTRKFLYIISVVFIIMAALSLAVFTIFYFTFLTEIFGIRDFELL